MNFEPGQLKISIEVRWGEGSQAITTEFVLPDRHHMLRDGNTGDLSSDIKRELCETIQEGVDKAIERGAVLKIPMPEKAMETADV